MKSCSALLLDALLTVDGKKTRARAGVPKDQAEKSGSGSGKN